MFDYYFLFSFYFYFHGIEKGFAAHFWIFEYHASCVMVHYITLYCNLFLIQIHHLF